MATYPPLIRPKVGIGEGPLGYIHRLAETNRVGGRPELLGVVFDSKSLLKALCLPTDSRTRRFVASVTVARHLFPQAWISRGCRFCPICLAEARLPVWRLGWELAFADACVDHKVWLVDHCSRCGAGVTWRRPRLLQCLCGRVLAREATAACADSVVGLAKTIVGSVFRDDCETKLTWIESLNLGQINRLVRFVGGYGGAAEGKFPQKIRVAQALATSWPYSTLAAEVLGNWPDAFTCVVEAVATGHKSESKLLSARFGHFYRHIYTALGEAEFEPVRVAFCEYLLKNWQAPITRRNRRLPTASFNRGSWLPGKAARQALGISKAQLEIAMSEGRLEWQSRDGVDGRKLIVVSRESVRKLRRKAVPSVGLRAAAAALGIGRARARVLIPRLFSLPDVRASSGLWQIPERALASVLRKINALQELQQKSAAQVRMSDVLKHWGWSDEDLTKLILGIHRGGIVPLGRLKNTIGLAGLVFEAAWLRAWQRARSSPSRQFSIPDTALRLGVKQEVAYWLVRSGLLAVTRGSGGRDHRGNRVSDDEICRFGREYVSACELASHFRTSSRSIIAQLHDAGVNPLVSSERKPCRQAFYLRSSQAVKVLLRVSGDLTSRKMRHSQAPVMSRAR